MGLLSVASLNIGISQISTKPQHKHLKTGLLSELLRRIYKDPFLCKKPSFFTSFHRNDFEWHIAFKLNIYVAGLMNIIVM